MAESAYFIGIGDALNAFPDPGDSVVLQDYAKRTSARLLKIQPADVRPVVRGKWVQYEFGDYHWHKCSVCGVADKFIETVYRKGFINNELISVRNFCPNCGAKMKNSISEVE